MIKRLFTLCSFLLAFSMFSFGQNEIYDGVAENGTLFEVEGENVYFTGVPGARPLVFIKKGNALYHPNSKKPAVSFHGSNLYLGAKAKEKSLLFTVQGAELVDAEGRNLGTIKGNSIVNGQGHVLTSCSDEFSSLEMLTCIYFLYYSESIISSK